MGIFRKHKEPQRMGVDLSQVIRGMQHAVNEAQRTLEVHHLKSLLRFFYADGDPKTVDLHLGGAKHIDIPLVTLANHSSLKIDELEMEFKARIEEVAVKDLDELKQILSESGGPPSEPDDASDAATTKLDGAPSDDEGSATFNIGFSSTAPRGESAGNVISVRIKFLSADQPEGLSRIIDEYNKLVAPYDVHPSSGDSGDPPTFVFDDDPGSEQPGNDVPSTSEFTDNENDAMTSGSEESDAMEHDAVVLDEDRPMVSPVGVENGGFADIGGPSVISAEPDKPSCSVELDSMPVADSREVPAKDRRKQEKARKKLKKHGNLRKPPVEG